MKDERPATLHERILTELRENILRGDWRPGHRIPFETVIGWDTTGNGNLAQMLQ